MTVDISAIAIIVSVVGVGVALGRMIQSLRADMHRKMDQRFAEVDRGFVDMGQRISDNGQRISELREDVREMRQDVSSLREEMGALRERTTQAASA